MTLLLGVLLISGAILFTVLFSLFLRVPRSENRSDIRTTANIQIHDQNREDVLSHVEEGAQDSISMEDSAALLQDSVDEGTQPVRSASRWQLLSVAALVPICALVLYWFFWGRPGFMLLSEAADLMASGESETIPQVEDLLRTYTEIHAEDSVVWHRLMTFQWYMEKPESFRYSFARALEEGVTTPYTDSLYVLDAFRQRQLEFTESDQVVIDRLRELEDKSQVLSLIDALDHTRLGDYQRANENWEEILRDSDVFGLKEIADVGQRATRTRLLPDEEPRIHLEVTLNKVPPGYGWLFLSAREEGGERPLLAARRQITQARRYEVTLDQSHAMIFADSLSNFDKVEVIARLTETKDALDQTTDLVVLKSGVEPQKHPHVRLVFGPDQPLVTVRVTPKSKVEPLERLFIIVAKQGKGSPPIAVRRLYGPLLQDEIPIDSADLMLPDTSFDHSQPLQVIARISKSGTANAQVGDVESQSVNFNLGETVDLLLNRVVGANPMGSYNP